MSSPQSIARQCYRLSLVVCVLAALGFAREAPGAEAERAQGAAQPAHLVFEPLADTGLSDILKQRRLTLEARAGKPLAGHAWWLWGLSAFDYDLDGDLDLIVCIHGGNGGLIIRNQWKETGRIAFVDATKELGIDGLVPSTDNYPLVWDFDGDGYLDIAGLLDDSPVPCLLNRGGKRFEKSAFSLHPLNYPQPIEDFNGDGFPDIRQNHGSKTVTFFYDPETATFIKRETEATPPIAVPPDVLKKIAALRESKDNRFMKLTYMHGDLNGDGRSDCILRAFGSYSGTRLGWYLIRDEAGVFHDRTADMGLPHDGAPMLAQDLDSDGDIDLLIASGKDAGLYLNDGRGTFTHQPGPLTDFVKQRCPYLQVAFSADLDNDGDADLAISNRRYGTQRVFENQSGGRFALAFESKGWDADPLVLRDINGDGLIDLIIGGAGEKENIGIFLNRTAKPGRSCDVSLRMPAPNVYAVGTKVEVYAGGGLGRAGARPLLVAAASPDGAPLHVGLGQATTFDLRVTFPGHKPLILANIAAAPHLTVTPAGLGKADK